MDTDIKNNFPSPVKDYRPIMIWAWNEDMTKSRIREQIKLFKNQGFGGFIFVAFPGLEDEYMGEKWMECVKEAVECAKEEDMLCWCFDEDCYPSGYAGGKVIEDNPEYCRRYIRMYKAHSMGFSRNKFGGQVVKIFSWWRWAVGDITDLADITHLSDEEIRERFTNLFVFVIHEMGPVPMLNNTPYVDIFNPDVVRKFIEVTHERYKSAVGEYFGDVIPGFFTDEINGMALNEDSIPWTKDFEKIFFERKGYDIMKYLPHLLESLEGYEKIRFDFWDLISDLFVESYTRQIYEWCDKNGLKLTGHYMEHSYPYPEFTGSVMPNFEYMHMPGTDMLFKSDDLTWYDFGHHLGKIYIVKQPASVAHQLGKERVLTETFGAAGWTMNFEDQKIIGDWQLALGANSFFIHLAPTSMRGIRKRVFPQFYTEGQSWWDHYKTLNDYFTRACFILSQGRFVTDILVLHPNSESFAHFSKSGQLYDYQRKADRFSIVLRNLSEIHYDYDLGDEVLIEKYGSVEDNIFRIGQGEYKTVILPPMSTIKGRTLDLLEQFADNGGNILCIEESPQLIEGIPSQRLVNFFSRNDICFTDNNKYVIKSYLAEWGNLGVEIVDSAGFSIGDIYYQHREASGRHIFFMTNISRRNTHTAFVNLGIKGNYELWDLETGEIKALGYRGLYEPLELEFYPCQSFLVVTDESCESSFPVAALKAVTTEYQTDVTELNMWDWKIKADDPNVLLLDYCSYSIGDASFSDEMYIRQADDLIRSNFGVPSVSSGIAKLNIMYREIKDFGEKVRLKFNFTADFRDDPANMYLVAESPQDFIISLNGNILQFSDDYYVDKLFKKASIGSFIRNGKNEVLMEIPHYRNNIELEQIYVIGDFTLDRVDEKTFAIRDAADSFNPHHYPFYPGTVSYTGEFRLDRDYRKVELETGEFKGACITVSVNGSREKVLGWEPYKFDITDKVRTGKNEIKVKLCTTMRNLMGPHHLKGAEKGWAMPGDFYDKGNWYEGYKLVNYGFEAYARITSYR